jgi:hypothetical protein
LKKTAAKTSGVKEQPKTYATMGALLKAKSGGTLPLGVKAKWSLDADCIEFHDGKGNMIASIDIDDFAKGELKRHDFKFVG